MKHHVIIETHRKPEGGFRAQVAEGPSWAMGYGTFGEDRQRTANALKSLLRMVARPSDTFDFLHAET